jgi:polysaccharide pyruvyl transferase WcaK-like protein
MGVNALAMGTFRCILHAFPDAEIFLFDYSRQPEIYDIQISGRRWRIPFVNIRFSKKPWQQNHILYLLGMAVLAKLIPSKNLRERWLMTNPSIRHLLDSDVVAAISGGDSFSDIYGYGRLFYMALPLILALLLGKDLLLLPQTLGPFKSVTARRVARYILSRAKRVYSRDPEGVRQAEALLGSASTGQIRFSHDVGFVLEPVPPDDKVVDALFDREPGVPLVGVNVSGLLYIGGYSKRNMFGLGVDYPRFVDELIRFLIDDCKAVVVLVPHVYGEMEGSESDTVASRQVYLTLRDRYGSRLRFIENRYTESQIKSLIGRCTFFVGSRMHACIAAVSQGVPAVPVAYSDKFVGVMETINIASLVADARKMTQEEILSLVRTAFEQRESIRLSLEKTMPAVKENVLGVFNHLQDGRRLHSSNQRSEERVGTS